MTPNNNSKALTSKGSSFPLYLFLICLPTEACEKWDSQLTLVGYYRSIATFPSIVEDEPVTFAKFQPRPSSQKEQLNDKKRQKHAEKAVRRAPTVAGALELLKLYDLPEVYSVKNKKYFENLLSQLGHSASLNDQKQIGDYFYTQFKKGKSLPLQKQVHFWKTHLEKRIDSSTDLEELSNAAEWYRQGDGIIERNIHKAEAISQSGLLNLVSNPEK